MEENSRELTIVRVLDAPREQVFKTWTDPELLAKWWGPNGVTSTARKLDLKPGGLIDIVMLAGDELGNLKGSEWPMTGVFQEIDPPSKLVYNSSAIMDNKPILDSHNTVTFEEENGKTKLTLRIVVTRVTAEAKGPLSGMKMGWTQSIDKLVKLVETRTK